MLREISLPKGQMLPDAISVRLLEQSESWRQKAEGPKGGEHGERLFLSTEFQLGKVESSGARWG